MPETLPQLGTKKGGADQGRKGSANTSARLERGRMGKNKNCRKTVVFPFQRVAAGNGQEFK
jgi:hypothetical protein